MSNQTEPKDESELAEMDFALGLVELFDDPKQNEGLDKALEHARKG